MVDRWLLPLIVRLQCAAEDRERGDIPGWVMITLMTVAVATAIWGLVNGSIMRILNTALGAVTGGGPAGTPPAGG